MRVRRAFLATADVAACGSGSAAAFEPAGSLSPAPVQAPLPDQAGQRLAGLRFRSSVSIDFTTPMPADPRAAGSDRRLPELRPRVMGRGAQPRQGQRLPALNTQTGATVSPALPVRPTHYLENVAEGKDGGAWFVSGLAVCPAESTPGAMCR